MNGTRTLVADAQKRLQGLDALRGIAAVAVMLFHFTYEYKHTILHQHPPYDILSYGHFGVHLFFVISGFVIFMTLDKSSDVLAFALSRFGRLFPAFWVSVVLSATFMFLAKAPLPVPNLVQIAANLTMVPGVMGVGTIDGSYWTLGVELQFYIACGFLFLLMRRDFTEFACVCWLLVSVLALKAFPIAVAPVAAGYCYLFVLGIMIFRIVRRQATYATYVTVIAALVFASRIGDATAAPVSGAGNAVVAASSALAVLVMSGWRWVISPFFLFLGRISYPLYLLHQTIGYIIIWNLEQLRTFNHVAAISIAMIAIFLLSTLLHHLVEKPCQRAIRAYTETATWLRLKTPERVGSTIA